MLNGLASSVDYSMATRFSGKIRPSAAQNKSPAGTGGFRLSSGQPPIVGIDLGTTDGSSR
jgi:hypothetical protein